MKNTISIYSSKGGVGKTSIAFSLSKDLGLKYLTNDISVSTGKLFKARTIKKGLKLEENTIYDFGGFDSEEAISIINQSQLVIVPTICDMNSLAKAISIIRKINHKNIIVIATSIESKKDFEDIKKVINHHFPDISVLRFRRTRLLKNAIESNKSALTINNGVYDKALKEYNVILQKCKEIITGG